MSVSTLGVGGYTFTGRRERGPEFTVAFIANEEPVGHPEGKCPPVDNCFGAQQGNLD